VERGSGNADAGQALFGDGGRRVLQRFTDPRRHRARFTLDGVEVDAGRPRRKSPIGGVVARPLGGGGRQHDRGDPLGGTRVRPPPAGWSGGLSARSTKAGCSSFSNGSAADSGISPHTMIRGVIDSSLARSADASAPAAKKSSG